MRFFLSVLSLFTLVSTVVHADVTDVQANGFAITNETVINATPEQVYTALLNIGGWWDPGHTYSGDAHNMTIDPKAGGCFCERVPGKGEVEHMRIVYVSKNEALRMSGGLGPLQELGVAGSLTWSLAAEGKGTKLVQSYNVGGYRKGGFADLAAPVDGVLQVQLKRLKAFSESK